MTNHTPSRRAVLCAVPAVLSAAGASNASFGTPLAEATSAGTRGAPDADLMHKVEAALAAIHEAWRLYDVSYAAQQRRDAHPDYEADTWELRAHGSEEEVENVERRNEDIARAVGYSAAWDASCAASGACEAPIRAVFATEPHTVAGVTAKLRVAAAILHDQDLQYYLEESTGDTAWLEAVIADLDRIGGAA